jgi:prepilin-type N-terminal cleavage/methylation domain-containing protein
VFTNNKGVTLVEVMIALVVLLIVFLGLMQTALLSIDSNLRNIYRDEAITIASQEMSCLKNTPFDSLTVGTACGTGVSPYCLSAAGTPIPYTRKFRNITKSYTICDAITNLDTDTRTVQVLVGWDHRNETPPITPTGKEFQFTVATVRRR